MRNFEPTKSFRPPPRRRAAFLLALAAGSAFLAACEKHDVSQPVGGKREVAPERAEGQVAPHPAFFDPEQISAQRDTLDRTVWKDEVDAQAHEQTVVRLWDDLRAAEDPLAVLAQVPFDTIVLGQAGEPEALENGISIRRSSGADLHLDRPQWAKFLLNVKEQGWRLPQTEWHHRRFEPAAQGPARSEFEMVLHAESVGPLRGAIVEGVVRVQWSDRTDEDGHFVPHTIEVSEFRIYERQGSLPFGLVATLGAVPPGSPEPSVYPVLVYDLDGDGLDEITLAGANRVYGNRGGMKFEERSLLPRPPRGLSAAVLADFTSDGVVDLLSGASERYPLLYHGTGGGGFAEDALEIRETTRPLLNPLCFTAGDIDGDGDLDAWLTQYRAPYVDGQMPTPYYDANDGYPAHLLANAGGSGFADRTEEAGLGAKRLRRTYSSSLLDLDEDGDLDLLVVSDFSGVDMYRNSGDGTFADVTQEAIDERAGFGMSHTAGDLDRDGRLDLYIVGMSSTTASRLHQLDLQRPEFPQHQVMRPKMAFGNRLLLGRRDGTYVHSPLGGDVARSGWSWGVAEFDFDLDGDRDIYVANGHISRTSARDYCSVFWRHDIYTGDSKERPGVSDVFQESFLDALRQGTSWNGFEHNKLFINRRQQGFLSCGFLMGVAFEDDSRSVVARDLDADGRPDLVVVIRRISGGVEKEIVRARVAVLRNQLPVGPHWIGIRLAGHRSPLGARIVVSSDGHRQTHVVMAGDSYRAQRPPAIVFGLGRQTRIDSVEVRWSGGDVERIEGPEIDRYYTID